MEDANWVKSRSPAADESPFPLNAMAFECSECKRRFSSSEGLQQHCRAKGHRPYECLWCKCSFAKGKHLIRHIYDTHNVETCHTEPLVNHKVLDQHLERYIAKERAEAIDEDALPYTQELLDEEEDTYCVQCNKFFLDNIGFKHHLESIHHWCFTCSRGFGTPLKLAQHHRSPVHNGVRNFKCPFCNIALKTTSAMVIHLEGDCPDMMRPTVTKHELTKPRIEVIPRTNPFCSVCRRELALLTRPPFDIKKRKCYLCWKRFETPQDLIAHMKETPEHQGLLFRCLNCETMFQRIRQVLREVDIKDKYMNKAKSLLMLNHRRSWVSSVGGNHTQVSEQQN